MATTHGKKRDGTSITEAAINELADEAEAGYDVDAILAKRKGGRPAIGSGPATVESVRLDPELRRELLLRASKDGISVSEVIRQALREYVEAS